MSQDHYHSCPLFNVSLLLHNLGHLSHYLITVLETTCSFSVLEPKAPTEPHCPVPLPCSLAAVTCTARSPGWAGSLPVAPRPQYRASQVQKVMAKMSPSVNKRNLIQEDKKVPMIWITKLYSYAATQSQREEELKHGISSVSSPNKDLGDTNCRLNVINKSLMAILLMKRGKGQ